MALTILLRFLLFCNCFEIVQNYSFYAQENQDGEVKTFSDWNKTISVEKFQRAYCWQRCKDGTKFDLTRNGCENLNCFNCSCKRPECEFYGICCPDMESTHYILPEHTGKTIIESEDKSITKINSTDDFFSMTNSTSRDLIGFPKLGCIIRSKAHNVLYIRSCFKYFTGSKETVRLCEEDIHDEEVTLDYYAWVVDATTNIVYRNMHCARCNRAKQPQQLGVYTYCVNYMSVYSVTDTDEMLRASLRTESCCKVTRQVGNEIVGMDCSEPFFYDNLVSSCDAAPKKWRYNNDIAEACLRLNDTIYQVVHHSDGQRYKNVFCSICSLNSYPTYSSGCTGKSSLYIINEKDISSDDVKIKSDTEAIKKKNKVKSAVKIKSFKGHNEQEQLVSPFSLLLKIQKSSSVKPHKISQRTVFTYTECYDTEWASPDGRCFVQQCSAGKILRDGKCVAAFSNIGGLQYRAQFMMVGENSVENVSDSTISYFRAVLPFEVEKVLNELSMSYKWTARFFVDQASYCDGAHKGRVTNIFLWLRCTSTVFRDAGRDKYEEKLINRIVENRVRVDAQGDAQINFTTLMLPNKFRIKDYINTIKGRNNLKISKNLKAQTPQEELIHCDGTKTFISVTRLLLCSYISFRPTNYNITMDYTTLPPEIMITVNLNVTKVNISTISELNMIEIDEEGNLNVCHELLDTKIEDIYRRTKNDFILNDVKLAQYIVTMTSLGCSMICLILTIFTYLWLPVIQTTAGKNNIFLCLSLLLAQISLIIASQKPRPRVLCQITGVVTHFLWLWMFSWTFICSFHMFNVFKSSARSQPSSERNQSKTLMIRVLYSLIGPSVVVSSVIVTSVISSDGENIGYGRDVCYLDSELLVGLATIGPLAFSLVCNVSFFIITVYTINKLHQMQSTLLCTRENQKKLLIYVKLSSMTGVFWIIAIVAEATEFEAFRFLSIILNGGQGVFLFLSYICNKRVVSLLQTRTSNQSQSTCCQIPSPSSGVFSSNKSKTTGVEIVETENEVCRDQVEDS